LKYEVLLTDEANRALERLPGPKQDTVLDALDRELARLEKLASRGQVDGTTYLRAPIAPSLYVVFRRVSPAELEDLRAEGRVSPDAVTAYVVLLLETG
jgi:hypothetical protein